MFKKFLIVFLFFIVMIPVMIIKFSKPNSEFKLAKPTHEKKVDSIVKPEQEVKYTNVCNICHKTFSHNGYEEISDGHWVKLSDPYSSSICSVKCGLKHTKEVHDLVDKVYDKYNNGIDPHSNKEYQTGNDGRIYETKNCSMCFGKGYTEYINPVNGKKESEVCVMCDGAGHLSY